MTRLILPILIVIFCPMFVNAKPPAKEFYEIRIYQYTTPGQEQTIDAYLQKALLPALHNSKIKAGVFKPIANDTAAAKKIYVIIAFKSPAQAIEIFDKVSQDKTALEAGKDYVNAAYDNPPYSRYERILLRAFPDHPVLSVPSLNGPKTDRVYELRSYEGPTEKKYRNKVEMFNAGGEVVLFNRLGFNAVFYADVIYGSRMPNLMYMTSFDNIDSRNEHWKAFGNDPEWKKLSGMDLYKNNVSHIDITLMHPTEYSDF
ncbi:MAG TPA: NIPSNAP family protein [Flavitalea sp.]|nr:NIPSNAP family protein [Flavitalea sp.]